MAGGKCTFQLVHFETDELILGNNVRKYIKYCKAGKVKRMQFLLDFLFL